MKSHVDGAGLQVANRGRVLTREQGIHVTQRETLQRSYLCVEGFPNQDNKY